MKKSLLAILALLPLLGMQNNTVGRHRYVVAALSSPPNYDGSYNDNTVSLANPGTLSLSLTISGNAILLWAGDISLANSGDAVSSVVDSSCSSISAATSSWAWNTSLSRMQAYLLLGCSAGAHTVVVNWASPLFNPVVAGMGISNATAQDGSGSCNSQDAGTSPTASGNMTSSGANRLVAAFSAAKTPGGNITGYNAGYTGITSTVIGSGVGTEYQSGLGTGTYSPNFTNDFTRTVVCGVIIK